MWSRTVEATPSSLTTEYNFNALGQLTNIHYVASDTPDITLAYNRLGQRKSVADAAGFREFEYDAVASLTNEAIRYIEGNVTNHYNLARSVDAHGRNAGYELSTAGGPPAPLQAVDYGYDTLGRFASVTSSVSSVYSVVDYDWMDGANLLEGYSTAGNWEEDDQFSPALTVGYQYEPSRNLKTGVTNAVGGIANPVNISTFAYTYDEAGRRTDRTDTFGGNTPVDNSFGYNTRDEVTSAMFGTDSYSYGFDDIGNRVQMTEDGSQTTDYVANELNQYTAITGGAAASPTYDTDGNMTGDGNLTYTWNGENRLVMASNATTLVEYAYDYMGRMFSRKVSAWNGSAYQASSNHSYLWDGWNMIQEFETDLSQSPALPISHSYIWGLDLSLTPQGAGGVGGLLSQTTINSTTTNSYFTAYDANGNVSDLVDDSGDVVAHYEYDAFGNQTASSGTFADANPWRFSTKYWEPETGLLHYELRPYVPGIGRWLTRDPIGEQGGLNLYAMVANNPVRFVDPLGLQFETGPIPPEIFFDEPFNDPPGPQGPSFFDHFPSWLGGPEDGDFVDNIEWFNQQYSLQMEGFSAMAAQSIVAGICGDNSSPFGGPWYPEQSWASGAYVLGSVGVSVEDLEVERDGRYYSYTATLVISDGLGLDDGEEASGWMERNVQEPLLGWFFQNRDITRSRTPLSGSGCCENE